MNKEHVYKICCLCSDDLEDAIEVITAEMKDENIKTQVKRKEARDFIIYCLMDIIKEKTKESKKSIREGSGCRFK